MTISIALGSNIHPEEHLKKAATMLRESFPGIRFSSVYRTKARDVEDQQDFLNAAALFENEELPEKIHERLIEMESVLKKSPPFRFGPRTIDLDLLLCGNAMINTPTLTVPHPRMHERRFVLEPLSELIDRSSLHPLLQRSWEELLRDVLNQQSSKTAIVL